MSSHATVAPARRQRALIERRNTKMARSAHAYVRGNTARFYEWLDSRAAPSLPAGPAIWICGDCHIGNIGPVADDEGRVHIQIRDFDQSVIGHPAHDLIRLALSLAMSARGSDLPGIATAHMMEAMLDGYEAAFPDNDQPEPDMPPSIKLVMKRALRRSWKSLARERLPGNELAFPLGKEFWPLKANERRAIRELVRDPGIDALLTQLRHRQAQGKVELLDAAYWRKGCSSLGKLRYAVLVDVDGNVVDGDDLCLVDIKEAGPPIAPRAPGVRMPRDPAERVVTAARHLSPALGERMRPARLLDRPVFVRELLPQDLKIDIARLKRKRARQVAAYLAHVVGQAHSRQMDADTRKAWCTELRRRHSRTLEAPSWLWSAVTGLLPVHEKDYLDHCRRYVGSTG
ncbi:hypothetical protein CA260_05205 [Dyella jiangningensis]|uniref:DUF2252 domain-containing protein n=2 Tax=Dyella jiangningensis TaxID=1379159 RepID=A0A328P9W8_9GAMM|nr:DUF2252 family protein [Dyella jiangningensis]RAO77285.1 hypothetical protein CA260_05205 [Dyella jiangningensis]